MKNSFDTINIRGSLLLLLFCFPLQLFSEETEHIKTFSPEVLSLLANMLIALLSILCGGLVYISMVLLKEMNRKLLYLSISFTVIGIGITAVTLAGFSQTPSLIAEMGYLLYPLSATALYFGIFFLNSGPTQTKLKRIGAVYFILTLLIGIPAAISLFFPGPHLYIPQISVTLYTAILAGVLYTLFCKKCNRYMRDITVIRIGVLALFLLALVDTLNFNFSLFNDKTTLIPYGLLALLISIFVAFIHSLQEMQGVIIETKSTLKRTSNSLRLSNNIMKKETRQKEHFLNTITHEIRTPLNTLLGVVDELIDSNIPHYAALSSAVNRIHISVSNIFSYHQLMKSTLIPVYEPVDVHTILRSVTQFHHEDIQSKGIRLTTGSNIGMKSDASYITDRTLVSSIVNNLLGKAVQFTENGEIEVFLICHEKDITITVSNTGKGFPETEIPNIAKTFTALKRKNFDYEDETIGLGLYITMYQIGVLHGDFTVRNNENGGCSFHVTIPAEQILSHTVSKQESEKQILIVEDNEINQKVLTKVLQKSGYHCTVVDNGADAIEALTTANIPFTLTIMDVQMPIMNGIEATKLARKEGITTPIIALTANADREECLNAGMDDYLSKPFQVSTVLQMVDQYTS